MVMNFEEGVPFDPGFIQHISAIIPNIQYMYENLEKYRNFGQKRNQFKMLFPKLEELINNYMGFYSGCILWAEAIKTLDNKPITGNYCVDGTYDEEETLQEVRFLRHYLECLPKDVKYYIGKDYEIPEEFFKVLDLYEEFLRENQGFIKVSNTNDIKVPEKSKKIENIQTAFDKIEEVTQNGKLKELVEWIV